VLLHERRVRSRGRCAIAVFAALAVGLVGCSPAEDTAPVVSNLDWSADDRDGTDPAVDPDLDPGVPEALQFTADLVGGGTFSGSSVADRPVVFWFWVPT
jgi:hypothetical protein